MSIASAFVPSSFVSGDMYGYFPIKGKLMGFYAVDVSGHGVHASLLSVAIGYLITHEFFKTIVLPEGGGIDPAALVKTLNDRFCTEDNDEYFTMFCGVIDASNGQLDYCQAAYPSPFYVDQSRKVDSVGDGGFPVGMLPNATYENKSLTVAVGGALVMCSDAASEAVNTQKQPFGLKRLGEVASTLPRVGINNIPDLIVKALTDWRGRSTLEDDLTVVAIERTIPNDSHNDT
jgi:sigma-B regulation protein RsbU (phosphoserine phosphatase)